LGIAPKPKPAAPVAATNASAPKKTVTVEEEDTGAKKAKRREKKAAKKVAMKQLKTALPATLGEGESER
ncbi:hypothetical protein HDV05_002376, partial [Chytridiales sp. JEL 0842]